MMQSATGEVLGPRPGLAICSFWQGKVEIALRIIAAVFGSLPALIAAAVALGTFKTFVDENGLRPTDSLSKGIVGSSAFIIAITALACVLADLFIIVRVCNIGLINLKISVFLTISIVIGGFLFLGHLAGGAAAIYYAVDSTLTSSAAVSPTFAQIRDGLIAAAAFCFFSVLLYGEWIVWDILFLTKDWNTNVLKYTLKETAGAPLTG